LEGQRQVHRDHQNLGHLFDNLYVPHMQDFAHEYLDLSAEVKKLKTIEKSRISTSTTELPTEDPRATNGNTDALNASNEASECPYSYFHMQRLRIQNSFSVREALCINVYMAVLASQAAYTHEPNAFLGHTTRPFAKFLHAWAWEQLEKETGVTVDANKQPEFRIFDADMGDTVIIAFKGTEDINDVFIDVQINTVSAIPGGVHAGFYTRSKAFPIQLITKLLRAGKRVLITGHSLGGAVATVLLLRMLYEEVLATQYQSNIFCITFGSPLVTGGRLEHSDKFLHIVHKTDLFPRLLLIKKQLYNQLTKLLGGTRLKTFVNDLATKAYEKLPWYAKLVADLGQDAYNIYQGQDPNAEWFTYKPVGNYAFLRKGKVHIQDEDDASDFMQLMMPNLDRATFAEALRDHNLQRYGEELEAVWARARQHREL